MFVVYIVDVNQSGTGNESSAPPHPDYPSPPPNAIPCPTNGSPVPIYYNQTIVLQCLTSGVVSPVLIIRKVDHGTIVVGGGLQDGAKGVPDHYCCPGEVCGDPVSQLHKIALEVYEPALSSPEMGAPGTSGAFLSCTGEKVNTYRPVDVRQWNGFTASSSPSISGSPAPSTPNSTASSSVPEYFGQLGANSRNGSVSPQLDYGSADGGRVRRKRGSLNGGPAKSAKGRRRVDSLGSGSSRTNAGDQSTASGALWSIDIGETAVWTVVGTGK